MIENIVQGIDIVVMAAIIFLPIIIGIKLNKVFNNNFWMILWEHIGMMNCQKGYY